MESFFLIREILDSIELYSNEIPIIIKNQNINSISLFWEVKEDQNTLWEVFKSIEDQNTLWEVFKSIEDRNSYFQYLKSVFEHEHEQLSYKLRIIYEPSLVEFNNKLASSIHLEWNALP
jgi:hypothetical protein